MKTIFYYFILPVILLQIVGCGLAISPYLYKNYTENSEKTCFMGEVMILQERGMKNDVYNTLLPGTIRWELVYAGKSNDNVRIYYREYVVQGGSWLAKDAFTQELNYDLKEGSLIRYKDVQLEIASANNEKIVYKVVSNKSEPSKE